VVRLTWLILAAILGMLGYDMVAHAYLGWTGYLVAGIGIGVGASVIGTLVHDWLAA
jgi:uncharacterized integral membrane protein